MLVLAPGNIHDARFIESVSIYRGIIESSVISDRNIAFGKFAKIPLVAIGYRHFHS